jgi:hypothetical protein
MGQRYQREGDRHEEQGQNDRRNPGVRWLRRFDSGGPDVKLSLQNPGKNRNFLRCQFITWLVLPPAGGSLSTPASHPAAMNEQRVPAGCPLPAGKPGRLGKLLGAHGFPTGASIFSLQPPVADADWARTIESTDVTSKRPRTLTPVLPRSSTLPYGGMSKPPKSSILNEKHVPWSVLG